MIYMEMGKISTVAHNSHVYKKKVLHLKSIFLQTKSGFL